MNWWKKRWLILKEFSSQKTNQKSLIILILISVGLLLYTSLRAAWLCITIDEASTYFSHVPNNVFNCFFSESCWSDANNHLLNTLLIQVSIGVFGLSEWSMRVPNLLGHLIYLIFSVLLVRRYVSNIWVMLAGFCLLNFNPYMIEFFSLARGYGLGNGWMMMSIYFLLRWVESEKWSAGIYCFLGSVLAVISNFTFLNYWASLSAIFVFFIFFKIYNAQALKKSQVIAQSSIPILTALVLFFLLKNPIQFLRTKGEFVYGFESLWENYSELIRLSVMGQGYFNPFTNNVFTLLSLILLGFSTMFGVFYFFKNWKNIFAKIYFTVIALMSLVIIGLVVQYYLLDVKYLMGRKSVMLIPLFGLSVYFLLAFLFQKYSLEIHKRKQYFVIGFAILISIFSCNHYYRTFDLKETLEWGHDAYTKDMIVYLNENLTDNKKIQLGVYWMYGPASEFYNETLEVEKIDKVKRFRMEELSAFDDLDYIYVMREHLSMLSDRYVIVEEFDDAGVLLRLVE